MKTDDPLENLLRGLRPAPLPADLAAEMREPPDVTPPATLLPWRRFAAMAGLAAACAALWWSPARKSPTPEFQEPAVSVVQRQSTLLDRRSLAVVEHEGRVWEFAEEEWLDEELGLCSATPVRVRSKATRHQVVCRPVDFD
jgi:hypothetical protein